MAYPASLPRRPVSFGAAVILEDGTPLGMRVELVASGSLVWAPTGTPLVSYQRTWDGAEDHERVFSLPVTDVSGYRTTNGEIIDVSDGKHSHTYSGRVTYFLGDEEIRRADIGPFPLPRGDGSVVDIDTLIPVTTTTGVTVSIPDRWSGIVTEAAILVDQMRDLIAQGGGGGSSNVIILEAGASVPTNRPPGTVYLRLLPAGSVPVPGGTGGGTGGGTNPDPGDGDGDDDTPLADVQPPTVPTNLAVSNLSSTKFRLSWSASTDNVAVQSYQVRLDGGTPIDVTGLSYGFSGLSPARPYVVQVRAKDFAGNYSAWSPSGFNVVTPAGGDSATVKTVFADTPLANVSGAVDGPAKTGVGFYTTLASGMDVIGARVFLPAGLSSGFYSNGIAIGHLLRSRTGAFGDITANEVQNAPTDATLSGPLDPGWNEVLFPTPIHVNQYSTGVNNAIWITMLYQTVPYYLHYTQSATDVIGSVGKPGVFLAEKPFPRTINSIQGSNTSSNGNVTYPLDIMVSA